MTISLLNSRNLISKLKTYFSSLEESEVEVSNAYGYVINGFPKIFGANLRRERLNKGLTQKDMYMKLSVTPSTYSYWETGSHPPRVNKVLEVLDLLSIDPGTLISENPAISAASQRLSSIPMLFSDSSLLKEKLKKYFPDMGDSEDEVKQAMIKILKNHPKEFGLNLRKFRTSVGLSQKTLCDDLGVSQNIWSCWEKGIHSPRLNKLARLSELLEVDVGEFFSITSIMNNKTIPLFSRTDFSCINSNHFFDYMLSHAPKQTTDYFQSEYQFAFVNDDDSMIGAINNIPLKSIVFCSTEKLNCETNISDLLLSLSGSVVLLSLFKGPAVLRELSFDGTYIRLKAWNPNVLEKICLLSEEQSLPQSNEQLAMYANHPLTVSMIEVFGVAKKVIMNL